ncbi:hypothetical protein GGR56DRAFT_605303 [Xylariaceae sp. FL0804]|nr:hypothetical protein GGR56DRAFT_605303 [Xylariaceae sp. FL0804]
MLVSFFVYILPCVVAALNPPPSVWISTTPFPCQLTASLGRRRQGCCSHACRGHRSAPRPVGSSIYTTFVDCLFWLRDKSHPPRPTLRPMLRSAVSPVGPSSARRSCKQRPLGRARRPGSAPASCSIDELSHPPGRPRASRPQTAGCQ